MMIDIANRKQINAPSRRRAHRPSTSHDSGLSNRLVWGIVLLVVAASWSGADMRPLELFRNRGDIGAYAASFFPPDFYQWRIYLDEILVTLQIAFMGTALAAVCAIPLGLLSASNIAPWWISQPVRRATDAAHAIHEMVFAMLFVMVVGIGPFAGVMALFVHTTGILAKLFSEAVEAIDPQPMERIRATGAHTLKQIVVDVLPQVMPSWISLVLCRFESNVRAATVVGMVGAGGIGVILWEVIRDFQYAQTCAVLLMIVVTVGLIELVSSRLRKMII